MRALYPGGSFTSSKRQQIASVALARGSQPACPFALLEEAVASR
jgi:hypothetical protein